MSWGPGCRQNAPPFGVSVSVSARWAPPLARRLRAGAEALLLLRWARGAGECLGNLLQRTCLHSPGPRGPSPGQRRQSLLPWGFSVPGEAQPRSERREQASLWPRTVLPKEG